MALRRFCDRCESEILGYSFLELHQNDHQGGFHEWGVFCDGCKEDLEQFVAGKTTPSADEISELSSCLARVARDIVNPYANYPKRCIFCGHAPDYHYDNRFDSPDGHGYWCPWLKARIEQAVKP